MRTSTSSLLAKAAPFFGEGRFSLKVLVTSASGLCEVTTGLAAEELLEAPIVDLWVTMRSSILSAVASVVAGMELMVHLGMRRLGGDSGCQASAAARVPNDARVPGSRVVEWRAARVHAVSASDWNAPSRTTEDRPDRLRRAVDELQCLKTSHVQPRVGERCCGATAYRERGERRASAEVDPARRKAAQPRLGQGPLEACRCAKGGVDGPKGGVDQPFVKLYLREGPSLLQNASRSGGALVATLASISPVRWRAVAPSSYSCLVSSRGEATFYTASQMNS